MTYRSSTAPDNLLKPGIADAWLEAKGVFLQHPVAFSLPSFYTRTFIAVINLDLEKKKKNCCA